MNDSNPSKQTKPPYISVARLEKMIELVSSRNLVIVPPSFFTTYGFNDSDATLAVSSLRFLGLVDDGGNATAMLAEVRLKGEAGKKVWEGIVRTSYKALFDGVNNPHELSADDLTNEFYRQYALSPRVASSAVPAFRKLCEYAGLIEEGSVVSRKQRSRDQSAKTSPSSRSLNVPKKEEGEHGPSSGLVSIPVAEGRMQISIPMELKYKILDNEELSGDWSILRTAIKNFADKHIPKKEEPKHTAESEL